MKSQGDEEYYLLGYNAVYSVESRPTFRRNISLPSSGSNNKMSKSSACHLLSRWFLAQLIFKRRHVPPKRRSTFNGLHGVISGHGVA
jgi:hypothetical protein